MKVIEIVLGCGDSEAMWGAEEPEEQCIDVRASYEEFGKRVLAELARVYPDTCIDVDWSAREINQRIWADCGDDYPGDAETEIRDIIGQVWGKHDWEVFV
jgi:hypothetical protein